MEFELSKPQKEIQKAAREFAKGEFDKELISELAKNREFPESVLQKAAELGFIGIHYPEACEGGGMGALESVLIAEEFCKMDSTMGMALMFAGYATECIFRFGSKEQIEKFVPPVVDGKYRSTGAFLESRTAGDLSAIETTAVKKDGNWIINGEKSYVPNGDKPGFYVVLCRTGEEDSRDKGLSLIVVEGDRDGITANDAGATLGGNLISFYNVEFENVTVPESNLLSKKGSGFSQTTSFLSEHRIQLAAMALGTAQGAFERSLGYVKQREQFGRKIAQFQITRQKIAEMNSRIEAARWLVYRTAWQFDRKKCETHNAAAAKLVAARTAMEVADEAIQLFGGYGYMTEYEVEHFYRDAKTIEILSGTPVTLKDAIADQVIGKIK